jgi:hypothetical protein
VTNWSFVGGTPFWELLGTSSELIGAPDGVIWSRKIFEVMPKLASVVSLFQTHGSGTAACAIRRQGGPDLNVVRVVVVYAAAKHQIAGVEVGAAVLCSGGKHAYRNRGRKGRQH